MTYQNIPKIAHLELMLLLEKGGNIHDKMLKDVKSEIIPTTIYKQLTTHLQFSFFDETDRLYGISPVSIAQVPRRRVYQTPSTAIRLLRVS